jgi:hypothetical protein
MFAFIFALYELSEQSNANTHSVQRQVETTAHMIYSPLLTFK